MRRGASPTRAIPPPDKLLPYRHCPNGQGLKQSDMLCKNIWINIWNVLKINTAYNHVFCLHFPDMIPPLYESLRSSADIMFNLNSKSCRDFFVTVSKISPQKKQSIAANIRKHDTINVGNLGTIPV